MAAEEVSIEASLRPIWDVEWPGRLAEELGRFRAAGIPIRIDPEAARHHVLSLEVDWPGARGIIPVKATYPDSFPHLRPVVQLRRDFGTFPSRHCSPEDGTLCLLGRSSAQWVPSLTLFDLLRQQLENAVFGGGIEDPQGEPAEFWWNGKSHPGNFALIDSGWNLKGVLGGWLHLRGTFRGMSPPQLRFSVIRVTDTDGTSVAELGSVPNFGDAEWKIPWTRADREVLPGRDNEYVKSLISTMLRGRPYKTASASLAMSAIVYETELGEGIRGDSWLFIVRRGASNKVVQGGGEGFVVRTLRGGPSDFGSRSPSFLKLQHSSTLLVGVGSLGSSVAHELAKNGIRKIFLLDDDVVEPGNSVRWLLGSASWGKQKTEAVSEFLSDNYPASHSVSVQFRIGQTSNDYVQSDAKVVPQIVNEVDLIIDCSAEIGITLLLSAYARSDGKWLLSAHGTADLSGGAVALFNPTGGCPMCLRFHVYDGSIPDPPGPDHEDDLIQPAGCSERTFQGASPDLGEISIHASRRAVALLTDVSDQQRSSVDVLDMTTDLPCWKRYEFDRHESCNCQVQG